MHVWGAGAAIAAAASFCDYIVLQRCKKPSSAPTDDDIEERRGEEKERKKEVNAALKGGMALLTASARPAASISTALHFQRLDGFATPWAGSRARMVNRIGASKARPQIFACLPNLYFDPV